MAHLDFKVTQWRKVFIPDDKLKEVIAHLSEGDSYSPYDISEIEGCYEVEIKDDELCEEPMLPNENSDFATQEVYDSEGNVIYRNGIGS